MFLYLIIIIYNTYLIPSFEILLKYILLIAQSDNYIVYTGWFTEHAHPILSFNNAFIQILIRRP